MDVSVMSKAPRLLEMMEKGGERCVVWSWSDELLSRRDPLTRTTASELTWRRPGAGRSFGRIAQALGGGDAHQNGLGFDDLIEKALGVLIPAQLFMDTRWRRLDFVELAAERQNVEQRIKQALQTSWMR
jgi:hypothetical protein